MDHSEAIETLVRERAAKLDSFADDIMGCRVIVEPAAKHHKHGNLYEVHIDLTVAGEEIAVTREPSGHIENKDVRVVLRDAFNSARRQLEDFVRRRRGFVKTHENSPHARVSKLFPIEGFGFLETPDGREVYFHRDSVLNEYFGTLQIGTEVTFVGEQGEKGPQASTVRIVGKHAHL